MNDWIQTVDRGESGDGPNGVQINTAEVLYKLQSPGGNPLSGAFDDIRALFDHARPVTLFEGVLDLIELLGRIEKHAMHCVERNGEAGCFSLVVQDHAGCGKTSTILFDNSNPPWHHPRPRRIDKTKVIKLSSVPRHEFIISVRNTAL